MSVTTWKTNWAIIDQSGDPQRYVGVMAAIRKQHEEMEDIQPFLRFCDLHVGERVLDVGSGPGWHVRVVSRIVGPTGRAVGVDLSEAMLAEARQVAAARGVDVDFVHGSAYALPFEPNSFDCCLSVGMTDILEDPAHAVREMVRVTRPGGRICLAEHYNDGIFIGPSGTPLSKRLFAFVREHEFTPPSGYEMMSILKSQGTTIEKVEGALQHSDSSDFALGRTLFLEEWLADAVAAGVLTSEEAQKWLADQEAHAREGAFFFGYPVYLIKATKQ
ncbi:MAG TPA: methyltransferase domain-containing protein [Ktedonobacterales bacterium]